MKILILILVFCLDSKAQNEDLILQSVQRMRDDQERVHWKKTGKVFATNPPLRLKEQLPFNESFKTFYGRLSGGMVNPDMIEFDGLNFLQVFEQTNGAISGSRDHGPFPRGTATENVVALKGFIFFFHLAYKDGSKYQQSLFSLKVSPDQRFVSFIVKSHFDQQGIHDLEKTFWYVCVNRHCSPSLEKVSEQFLNADGSVEFVGQVDGKSYKFKMDGAKPPPFI